MHIDVVIDSRPDGQFEAWVETCPSTRVVSDTKQAAERIAISLFLEEIAGRIRTDGQAIDGFFPLFATLVDRDLLHCSCSQLVDPHLRVEHLRVREANGSVHYGACSRAGCSCAGFTALWPVEFELQP